MSTREQYVFIVLSISSLERVVRGAFGERRLKQKKRKMMWKVMITENGEKLIFSMKNKSSLPGGAEAAILEIVLQTLFQAEFGRDSVIP